jgi:hypothetical protein
MRTSRRGQTGTAAEIEVTANFVNLDWGVARNPDHDLGTDLWLMPADERLFDLGLMVGVQVKGGPSRFDRPEYDAEHNVVGWWFPIDRPHADYWLSHVVPHLLVLHNLETGASFWVHINLETVISTGVGAKLLVPASQTVTDDQRDALLAVAASSRPKVEWEGSAWTGAGSLLPRDVLRHALIVPRLVAPHPNTGQLKITAEQAVALLVQARVREVMIAAERYPEVPSLKEARDSPEWSWRFVGALAHRVTTGSIDLLLQATLDPPDASSRAASTVAAATALIEEGRSEESLELLSATIDRDQSQPVDQAWLIVQRARLLADIGRVEEARADAISVQKVRQTHPEDVTATAIAGVAASLLFNASAWGERDIEQVITNTDTAAAWWRTQTTSGGLSALALREFKGWARDRSVTLGGGDEVNDPLFAGSLMANLLGDHGTWRFLSGLLGKQALLRLDRGSDVEAVRSCLETLRIAGDESGLTLAVNRVVANGPADAVTLLATEVDLDSSTHTTGPTNLALLSHGGDVLDVETADRTVIWLLGTLRDPTPFAARTNPSYLIEPRLVETLAGVVFAASVGVRRSVVEYLVALPDPGIGILAHSWGRVLDALPDEDWDEELCLIIAKRTDAELGELRLPLRELASRFSATAREGIKREALGGSLEALGRAGDIRALPTAELSGLISTLTERVRRLVTDARAVSYGHGGHDAARALALLNSWHLSAANWEPLLELLKDPAVAGYQKEGALEVLTSLERQLPDELRQELAAIAEEIQGQQPVADSPFLGSVSADALGPATELAAALRVQDEADIELCLLTLLAGDSRHREWAARVIGRLERPQDQGALAVLAQDPEPEVRAVVGAILSNQMLRKSDIFNENLLQRLLADPGTRVHHRIAGVLAGGGDESAEAAALLRELRGNRSALVRLAVTRCAQ